MLIVDLCGTLVRENTTHGFVRRLPLPMLTRLRVSAVLSHLGGSLYRRSGIDVRSRVLIPALRGLHSEVLRDCAVAYARDCLTQHNNPIVLRAVQQARASGAKIILATASLDPIAAAFCDILQLDGFVSARLAFDSRNVCLGFLAQDTTGQKLKYVCEQFGTNIRDRFDVFTDNSEDVDLMTAAQQAYFIGHARMLPAVAGSVRARITCLSAE